MIVLAEWETWRYVQLTVLRNIGYTIIILTVRYATKLFMVLCAHLIRVCQRYIVGQLTWPENPGAGEKIHRSFTGVLDASHTTWLITDLVILGKPV